jgi:hypothetical protein
MNVKAQLLVELKMSLSISAVSYSNTVTSSFTLKSKDLHNMRQGAPNGFVKQRGNAHYSTDRKKVLLVEKQQENI